MRTIFRNIIILAVIVSSAVLPSLAIDEQRVITDFLWQRFVSLKPPRRPRIALVLSGGGARGLAHIGVLKVLAEQKVPIDLVVGTSVGALIGALYCSGESIEKIETLGEKVQWNDLTNINDSNLVRLLVSEHLLSTEKMEKYLEEKIGHKHFDELPVPFACLATDLITGERVIFREGEVAPAARASSTIPGIFDPVEYRHRYLVDGGLFDNIPTDVARLMDADIIIAVAVTSDFSKNSMTNVFKVLTQSIYIQGRLLDEDRLKLADFVIRPKVNDVTAIDLGRSRDCIDAGITAARVSINDLKLKLIERTSEQFLLE